LAYEYPTITALLSNGRKIGPYSTDSSYGEEKINGVTYTKAEFTLSKQNGFTLSEGKMQITIWMNSTGKKEAIGNVTLNVINTTAFDDGDIIVSGDVEGTIVNYKVELENLQSQVNTFNGRLANVETNKAEKTELNSAVANLNDTINTKANQSYAESLHEKLLNLASSRATIGYVNEKFNQILGEGASETLDTIGEIAKAFEEHQEVTDAINQAIGNKADKTELNALETKVNSKADISDVPTKLSQLEQDIEISGGGALIDLGKIDEDPNNVNNSVLNNIKQTGVYTFTYTYKNIFTTFTYLMKVEYRGQRYIQTIFEAYIEDKNYFNFIVRKSPLLFEGWEVSSFQLVDRKYVSDRISSIPKFTIEVVDELPTENISNTTVYLLRINDETNNMYEEYIYVGDTWELLGTANSGGVGEEEVMQIIEENSAQTETLNIGTSDSYDETSDSEVPTTKAVKTMLGTAKLVATGTYNNTVQELNISDFILNNRLKKDRLYLVKITDQFEYHYSVIIYTGSSDDAGGVETAINIYDYSDNQPVDCNINYYGVYVNDVDVIGHISIYSNSGDDLATSSEYASLKVYELPITIGGNE
jgi:hypothetical protein